MFAEERRRRSRRKHSNVFRAALKGRTRQRRQGLRMLKRENDREAHETEYH